MHIMNSLKNPHSRPLPQGWSEHFDTERKIWYYVDLDSIPPRASLVHPADDVSQKHWDQSKRSSAVSRPLPTIPAAAGITTTPAQRLYATAMTSNLSHSTSQPSESVHVSIGSIDQHVSMSAPSIVDSDTALIDTSQSLTQASSPITPSLTLVTDVGPSQPRSRRLRESRQTALLSLSPLSAIEDSTGRTLYNPVVQTSTLDTKPRLKAQYDVRQEPGSNKATWDVSVGISRTEGHNIRQKPLPPTPIDGKRSNGIMMTRTKSYSQHTTSYSGITEDNAFFVPAEGPRISSTEQNAILIDEVPPCVSPIQNGLQQPIASSSFTGSRSADQVIFQPRPIKPLRGLSASFQDQIREAEASQPTPSLEDQLENVASRKTPVLKRFSVGLIRAASGKSVPDKDIRQDGRRPSRHYDGDSSWMPVLDSSLDESFVLVDDARF